MTETLILTGLLGCSFGFLVGLVFVTWRDVTPRDRAITDLRRELRQQEAALKLARNTIRGWRENYDLLSYTVRIDRLARGLPLDDTHNGSRKAPVLEVVDGGGSG